MKAPNVMRIRRARLVVVIAAIASMVVSCSGGSDPSDPFVAGRTIYGDICSACHGSSGRGGVGPDLSTVTGVFPDCEEQVRWISLGSDRWLEEVGETFGAQQTPLQGGMPSMAGRLTDEEIRQVAAFEREQFGGATRSEAQTACRVTTSEPPSSG